MLKRRINIMITPRLQSIINNVTGKTLSDIGTDHAYIPIYMLKNHMINSAVACDIKQGPLGIARQHVKKYQIENIELRLGSGLEPIECGETETVIIAGMGGEMIIKILSADLQKSYSFNEIILQPMNYQSELRYWLVNNGFKIVSEDLSAEAHKVYNLIKIKKGKNEHIFKTELSYHLPEYLHSHPLFYKLYEKKKREFNKILNGRKLSENGDESQIALFEGLLKEMEKIEVIRDN